MPELPEVETTRRGLAPALVGSRILDVRLHEPRLRWPVDPALPRLLAGSVIQSVDRRAKYLLIATSAGTLIVHLGMTGSLRVLPADRVRGLHDQWDVLLQSREGSALLRFHDPRRFGSLHFTTDDPGQHALLRSLAPEPFDRAFNAAYLHRITRGRRAAIKQILLNGHLVTGVGNIYASEALHRAAIHPRRAGSRMTLAQCQRLCQTIRDTLRAAIRSGGSTLRNYVGADGEAGYFSFHHRVYDRERLPCQTCGTAIRRIVQGQRSTFFCPGCQK